MISCPSPIILLLPFSNTQDTKQSHISDIPLRRHHIGAVHNTVLASESFRSSGSGSSGYSSAGYSRQSSMGDTDLEEFRRPLSGPIVEESGSLSSDSTEEHSSPTVKTFVPETQTVSIPDCCDELQDSIENEVPFVWKETPV